MTRDFYQQEWNERLQRAASELIRLAIEEDNESDGDLTSRALVPESILGAAGVVARESGVAAGLAAAETVLSAVDSRLGWVAFKKDGDRISPGETLGRIEGPVRTMLTAERLLLNLVGRLTGIATLTAHYVEAIHGTGAAIYDTRKTTLGWRRLEKYAVRCGGGHNHRTGLFDAILIKDNHLASVGNEGLSPAAGVRRAKIFLDQFAAEKKCEPPILEVEVDSLEQLENVLSERPDVVLLDNMLPDTLRRAVALRRQNAPETLLEASGGITLETVRAVAETGVDRVSVGALTHSARSLDLGLDWGR